MAQQENSIEDLIQHIAQAYESLPKQLKSIAQYVTQHRQNMVVARILDVAHACDVQPSAVVRFAQRFGFSGFSELQAVFRDAYASGATEAGYRQRIQAVISEHTAQMRSAELARGFMQSCQNGIAALSQELDEAAFERAVSILQEAHHIYIMGVRRMYPVAAYLSYTLSHTNKRVALIDGMGGMFREQVGALAAGDALIAISVAPYGAETRHCTELAAERGANIIAITDSSLSPIARLATATLRVEEPETYFFRALSSMMCLAQSLFIALAYRLELDLDVPPAMPAKTAA